MPVRSLAVSSVAFWLFESPQLHGKTFDKSTSPQKPELKRRMMAAVLKEKRHFLRLLVAENAAMASEEGGGGNWVEKAESSL